MMKKMIIIGNGFDLAHGLNTSYKSFLLNYLHSVRENLLKHHYYTDNLLSIGDTFGLQRYGSNITDIDLYNWFKKYSIESSIGMGKHRPKFETGSLFKKLLIKLEANWVDIENEYFQSVIDVKDNENSLINLNNEFSFLKDRLIEYLKNEEHKNLEIVHKRFSDLFLTYKTNQIMFLNFNYTNTIEKYIEMQDLNASVIYIHGDLHKKHGEPIFGIGDEHHSDYVLLKENNSLTQALRYSKSIWYLRSGNYDNLINYILEADIIPFEVEVFGHSCGLSDRTILKYIFQHDNCRKIKLFHYDGIEEYSKKTIEVQRHFDDPHKFIQKVEPFNSAYSMNIDDDS